jgi:hypothetical protein
MDINAQKLIELAAYFTIIHHIKGRIRLRASPKIEEQRECVTLKDIEALPSKIKGIKSIKINKIVGSVTIEYDAEIFPSYLWENLVHGNELDEIITIINTLSKEFI